MDKLLRIRKDRYLSEERLWFHYSLFYLELILYLDIIRIK
jgi:hypothetical protein